MLKGLAVVTIVFCVQPLLAQSECSEILRQGIYNRYREEVSASSKSDIRSSVCRAYSEYEKDVKQGSVKASYKLFSGEAEASAERVKAVGETMCKADLSQQSADDLTTRATDLVSTEALREFTACKSLEQNLIVKTNYVEDPTVNGVTLLGIDLAYKPGLGVNDRPEIQRIEVSPVGAFVCRGPLVQLNLPRRFTSASIGMTCQRNIAQNATKRINDPNAPAAFAPAAEVTVHTGAGAVRRSVPAITPLPAPLPTINPVASVVAFAAPILNDTDLPTGWLPCDGRALKKIDYPELFAVLGTRYGTGTDSAGAVVGDFNLPDYRGLFLRGLERATAEPLRRPVGTRFDPERSDAGSDAGSLQGHAFQEHTHGLDLNASPLGQRNPARAPGGIVQNDFAAFGGGRAGSPVGIDYANPVIKPSGGAPETRPVNIAVHYLIRVR